MRNLCLAVILTGITTVATAATSPLVRILLPLYVGQPVPGAYGSLWQSQLVIHNGSMDRTFIIETCPPTEDCFVQSTSDQVLLPGETQTGLPVRYPTPANPVAGAVLYLDVSGTPRDNADAVAFQLRVVDLSRSATAAGTEVPVLRERDFRSSTVHLMNVPTDARFRLALRLFELNLARADFAVRVFDQATNALLSARRITTITPVLPQGFTPAFAEIDDVLSGTSSLPAQVRIEIEPLTAGIAFWSYVSITNNDSQQITLVTPQ